MAHVSFENCEFVRSHMRQPRGRGAWVFRVNDGRVGSQFVTFTGSFGEAKAQVREWVRTGGFGRDAFVTAFVQP